MQPELFCIPFINISIKSYGAMMVLGFLSGLWMSRWRCRKVGGNPDFITNLSIYILFAGVFGARFMHVFHNWESYQGNLGDILAIWSGGLEFLGGVVLAVIVAVIIFRWKKLSALHYMDILAPGLMLGLAFGRVGCLLNGCCFGAPCDVAWGARFPAVNHMTQRAPGCEKETLSQYSYAYDYQLTPDLDRYPDQPPLVQLPNDYYRGYLVDKGLHWVPTKDQIPTGQVVIPAPKPMGELTASQIEALKQGHFPMHKIHPAQIYSIIKALGICLILNIAWRWRKKEGQIFSLMLILYGIARFLVELLRVEPLEFDGLSISQNMGLILVVTGFVLWAWINRQAAQGKHPTP